MKHLFTLTNVTGDPDITLITPAGLTAQTSIIDNDTATISQDQVQASTKMLAQ